MKKRIYFIATLIPLLISAIINVYFAFVLQNIIDITEKGSIKLLYNAILFALLYLLGDIIVSIIMKFFIGLSIRNDLIMLKDNRFAFNLSCNIKDDISSRVSIDIENIENEYYQQKYKIIYNIVQVILGIIAIIYVSFILTVSIAIVTIIPIMVPVVFTKILQTRKEKYLIKTAEYNDFLSEVENGKMVISDFNLNKHFLKQHSSYNKFQEDSRFKSKFILSIVEILSENFGMLTFITALGVSSYFVIQGSMTFGLMIAAIQLMNNIVQPINSISNSIGKIKSVEGILKEYEVRYNHSMDKKVFIDDIKKIEFEDVSYNYPDGTMGLSSFSMSFFSNNSYAIIGESGIGKSTLLKLLVGDYTDYSGVIKINDIDIKLIDKSHIKSKIGFVRQEVFLFNDSIKNNLLLWNYDKIDDYLQAIDITGLNHLDNIDLDKHISNHTGLSGGQKQRIGIGRVLLNNYDVLLFDEITSALDIESSKKIMQNIVSKKGKNKMSIFITHQSELNQYFDHIIRINKMCNNRLD